MNLAPNLALFCAERARFFDMERRLRRPKRTRGCREVVADVIKQVRQSFAPTDDFVNFRGRGRTDFGLD